MKLASWNVNSINLRKEKVLNWITSQNIDILGLQEIKCEEDKFPKEFFQEKNFHVEIIGQKSYNGVAIISKYPIRVLNKIYLSLLRRSHKQDISKLKYKGVFFVQYTFQMAIL